MEMTLLKSINSFSFYSNQIKLGLKQTIVKQFFFIFHNENMFSLQIQRSAVIIDVPFGMKFDFGVDVENVLKVFD